MKNYTNLVIGSGFILFGVVMALEEDIRETILYLTLGAAFILTWMGMHVSLTEKAKKALTIVSWVLIGFSLFWFFYLVRTDQWNRQ